MGAFLRLTKKLICPQCGDVLADADYRPLVGSLTLTAPGGDQLTPQMGAVHMRRAEEQLATADSAVAADEARTRLEFVRSHIGELIYDLPCHRGHYILATAPQMTRSMRRTQADWVSPRLAD